MLDDLIFTCDAVLPLVLLVLVGYLLKLLGLFPLETAKQLNKLVFKFFLPIMLFVNVYEIESLSGAHFSLMGYGIVLTLIVFFAVLPLSGLITADRTRRSAVVQASFRSNYALIGMPLAKEIFGTQGVIAAAMLSLAVIPLYNVLAVSTFAIFSPAPPKEGNVRKTLVNIAKNPIIIGVLAGFAALGVRALFHEAGVSARLCDITPLYKALVALGDLATPVALVALGARFEFSAVASFRRELVFSTAVRCLVVPAAGLAVAYFLRAFDGAQFAALLAMLATPVAVSSVPMAQESGADSDLAGQIVVWTTVISALTIFAFTYILKTLGVF